MRSFHTAPRPHHAFTTPGANPYMNRLVEAQTTKVGRIGRWYLPSMAMICLGFGLLNYIRTRPARNHQLTAEQLQLLEAYGSKNNIDDVERAMEIYEVQ